MFVCLFVCLSVCLSPLRVRVSQGLSKPSLLSPFFLQQNRFYQPSLLSPFLQQNRFYHTQKLVHTTCTICPVAQPHGLPTTIFFSERLIKTFTSFTFLRIESLLSYLPFLYRNSDYRVCTKTRSALLVPYFLSHNPMVFPQRFF